jgi:hypothetical protein
VKEERKETNRIWQKTKRQSMAVGNEKIKLNLKGDILVHKTGKIKAKKKKKKIQNRNKKEVLGRTNRLLSLIRHGPHRKRRVQQFFYCCECISYRGNVSIEPLPSKYGRIFTEPLPSNDNGIFTEPLPSN